MSPEGHALPPRGFEQGAQAPSPSGRRAGREPLHANTGGGAEGLPARSARACKVSGAAAQCAQRVPAATLLPTIANGSAAPESTTRSAAVSGGRLTRARESMATKSGGGAPATIADASPCARTDGAVEACREQVDVLCASGADLPVHERQPCVAEAFGRGNKRPANTTPRLQYNPDLLGFCDPGADGAPEELQRLNGGKRCRSARQGNSPPRERRARTRNTTRIAARNVGARARAAAPPQAGTDALRLRRYPLVDVARLAPPRAGPPGTHQVHEGLASLARV